MSSFRCSRCSFSLEGFKILSFFSALVFCTSLTALNAPRLEAFVSATEVNIAESLELTFTLSNAKSDHFQAPDLSDFEILAGPFSRISAGLVEGEAQTAKSLVYIIRPRKTGVLRIGPASVLIDTMQLQTQPIQISAVKRDIQTSGTVFAETRFSKPKAFVGQPFWMDIVVFYADSNWTVQAASAPEIPGFVVERCAEPVKGFARIKGRTWFSSTERIWLSPQQSGEFTMPAFRYNIMEWRRDAYSPYGHSVRREVVGTRPEKFVVYALPPDTPPEFTGAVGFWKMKLDWIRSEGQPENNLRLQLTLQGEGDVKRLQAPKLMLPAGLTAFPAKTRDIPPVNPCRSMLASKIFDYALTAAHTGRFKAEVRFVFFNPDSGKFEVLHSTTPELEVNVGSEEMEIPHSVGKRTFPTAIKYLIFGLLASVLFFWVWRRHILRKRPSFDSPALPLLLTPEQRLQPAWEALERRDAEGFYKVLSEIILQALSEKWGTDFTRAEILGLQKNNVQVNPATAKLLWILQAADSVRFSGGTVVQKTPEEWYELTMEALGELDESPQKALSA